MAKAALVLTLGLAACVASPDKTACGAERFQNLVGQPLEALAARLPEDSYKVDRPLPDGTVTLEEFPDRLRVTVDRQDVILQVFCG